MADAERRSADSDLLEDVRGDDGAIEPAFVQKVAAAVAAGDADALLALVQDLHEADLGDLIEALDTDDRPRLIELLGAEFDFSALTEIDDTVRVEILDELEATTIAEGVRDLDSDDAVYILEDLDEVEKQQVLDKLSVLDRLQLTRALDYPEGSVGRRMQSEFVALPPFWTVGQTIDYLRETDDLPERFFEVIVVDPGYRLLGTVALDRVLRTKRTVKLQDVLDDDPHTIEATGELEEAAREFERYNMVSAPVVDDAGRLVGVLTVDDVVDAIEEAADADLKALGGVKADEELSDSVTYIAKSRFTWLFVNLLTAILASVVIAVFEGAIEKMVALAVLMPIVSSMGGNAGTQTMTVVVRALATQELGRANAWRILRRELFVGLLNGLAFAVIMGGVAAVWFGNGHLLPVMGIAMVVTLVAAALGGLVIPLLLQRAGVDPAVASGPLVTTITDVVGFFSFLGIAALWFGIA